jgi:hypothetical protein
MPGLIDALRHRPSPLGVSSRQSGQSTQLRTRWRQCCSFERENIKSGAKDRKNEKGMNQYLLNRQDKG